MAKKKHESSDPDPIDSTQKLVQVLQYRLNQTNKHSIQPLSETKIKNKTKASLTFMDIESNNDYIN